jgi:hypothetical protein
MAEPEAQMTIRINSIPIHRNHCVFTADVSPIIGESIPASLGFEGWQTPIATGIGFFTTIP